jgi:hypothetical protein
VRYGYHLVADCRKAKQGNKSHKDVDATIIHHVNTYTSITATKIAPFSNGTQADILLSGITTIDNPATPNWLLDVTSTNPQPGAHQPCCPWPPAGPRGTRLPQRRPHQHKARGGTQTRQVRRDLLGNRVYLFASRARDDGRARCLYLYRVGVLPLHQAIARLGSAGGRARGQAHERHLSCASPEQIAQVTTALDAAQHAVKDELALNEAG